MFNTADNQIGTVNHLPVPYLNCRFIMTFGSILTDLNLIIILVKQRELRIIEHYPVIVKGQNFILVCTDIYGVAKMIFISFVSRFRLFLFGWCSRNNYETVRTMKAFFFAFIIFKMTSSTASVYLP